MTAIKQPYHVGIENVDMFEKTRLTLLRQRNMMWLENNTNFNTGFQLAWIALQGTASETATNNVAHKRCDQMVKQLQAENTSLQIENEELRRGKSAEKVETLLPEVGTVAEVVGTHEDELVAKAQAESKQKRSSRTKGQTTNAKTSE